MLPGFRSKACCIRNTGIIPVRHLEIIYAFLHINRCKNDYSEYLSQNQELILNNDILQQITRTAPALLRLQLPDELNIELDLYRSTIYSSGAQIKTSSGERECPIPIIFFTGA